MLKAFFISPIAETYIFKHDDIRTSNAARASQNVAAPPGIKMFPRAYAPVSNATSTTVCPDNIIIGIKGEFSHREPETAFRVQVGLVPRSAWLTMSAQDKIRYAEYFSQLSYFNAGTDKCSLAVFSAPNRYRAKRWYVTYPVPPSVHEFDCVCYALVLQEQDKIITEVHEAFLCTTSQAVKRDRDSSSQSTQKSHQGQGQQLPPPDSPL